MASFARMTSSVPPASAEALLSGGRGRGRQASKSQMGHAKGGKQRANPYNARGKGGHAAIEHRVQDGAAEPDPPANAFAAFLGHAAYNAFAAQQAAKAPGYGQR